MQKIKLQCLQILDEGAQNDPIVAMVRSARSAALLLKQMRPSLRKRVKAGQRFSR
jgi:hypothetical protein